jgi:signal transduction histidine kinase
MEHTAPTPTSERSRLATFLMPLIQGRTYLATLDLWLDLAFGVLWLSFFTSVTSVGFGMLITLIGLPILTFAMLSARVAGRVERWRVRTFLATPIEEPARRPRKSDGLLETMISPFRDESTYRDIFYVWLVQPVLGLVNFVLAVVVWSVPLWLITLPIYAIAWPEAAPEVWFGNGSFESLAEVVPAAVIGAALLPLAPWVIRGLAKFDAAVARRLLSPSRTEELEGQIDTLRETQARSVDIAMADRRQIERDLHDGAQQRLLALGMDLGMALEKFESDPDAARALVGDAHQELQRAVAELRNLARGVHPAVLTDRGLDAALSALAARSPVPVRLDVDLGERPPASVEATAYFIVAEALTNAARYANASNVEVRVKLLADTLHVTVVDDGIGGAAPRPGSGLAGLADRASSVEGSLQIASPVGGPTVISAELPCGS